MRAKRDMQSTGVRKKMSLNNFDHLSRDLYDKAKRSSPRGGQSSTAVNNITPAPDFDTKDELANGQTVMTLGMIDKKNDMSMRNGSSAMTTIPRHLRKTNDEDLDQTLQMQRKGEDLTGIHSKMTNTTRELG